MPNTARPHILHVTESLGGGIVSALEGYIKCAPFASHSLLAAERQEAKIDIKDAPLTYREILPSNPFAAINSIRVAVKRHNPDFIHLHSSFAGAYGRLALLPREKIIYTPHAFAFERRDISFVMRAVYYMAEQCLSFGGTTLAGVAPHEVELGKSMIGIKRSVLLPNYAEIPVQIKPRPSPPIPSYPITIAMSGRLCPQKDPDFFVAICKLIKAATPAIRFIWLGGGDTSYTKKLEQAGIAITGWLPRDDILQHMCDIDIYVHTAAWEGNPMTVLEAAALGLPVITRDISSLRSIGITSMAATPEGVAELVLNATRPENWNRLLMQSALIQKTYSAQVLQNALQSLYSPEK